MSQRKGEKFFPAVEEFGRRAVSIPAFLLLFFSFFAIIGSAQLKSDHGWLWQNPLPQGNSLYSIHFAPDHETGFAVGDDRTILKTEDGGFTWKIGFAR